MGESKPKTQLLCEKGGENQNYKNTGENLAGEIISPR